MIVAVFAIPLLIGGYGTERFGLLTIIWMGVGYFSLFDMGFGRALTKLISDRFGAGDLSDLRTLIWTALSIVFVLSIFGAGIISLGAEVLIRNVLNVEVTLQDEGIMAMRILAFGIPSVVLTSALVGILEAHQKFATITAVRVPLGILTFAGPLTTLQFSKNLIWATTALVTARLFALVAYYFTAASVRPELKHFSLPLKKYVAPLFHFGGWLTITNIVGPVMVYFDRFLIGAILTMTAVSYYVTPYEVLSRLQLLPNAMVTVLFPSFSVALIADKKRLVAIYSKASLILLLILLPVISASFLFASEGLQIWLGDEFRRIATPVVQWLSVGWLINALARMPLTVLQSAGRPDLVAKTHLLELLPYITVLWVLTNHYGIVGTAAAWSVRVFADTIILNLLASYKVPELKEAILRTMAWIILLILVFSCGSIMASLLVRVVFFLTILCISVVLLWPVMNKVISIRSA